MNIRKLFILVLFIILPFSKGYAMDRRPDTDLVLVECQVENTTIAQGFSDAICPAFMKLLSERWPEKDFLSGDAGLAKPEQIFLQLKTDLASETMANTTLSWASGNKWNQQAQTVGQTITLQVSDHTLDATMVENLLFNVLKLNNPF